MSKRAMNKVLNSKFITRSKIIFVGSLIAQIIAFATSFVLTGYFTPEDLGLLGTLTALISIVSGTLSFRSELAVIHADKEDAPNVFFQSTLFSAFCSTLFCLICFFLPWEFAKKITTYFLPFLLWTWAYFLFFNSKQLSFKFNELNIAASGSIWRNAVTLVYQLVGGIINPTFAWILSGRIIGDYVGTWIHAKNYWKLIDFKKSTSNWKNYIRKNSDYILYMTPHHLCLTLSSNIVIFFLEDGFGLAIVGFFSLAQRLIQAPMEILGSTLFNITTQRFSELKDDPKDLKKFYIKIIVLSFVISSICGVIIFFAIDFVIPWFGTKWLGTSGMVKSLIPLFMTTLIVTPTTYFLRIIGKSAMQLGMEIIELISKLSFLIFFKFGNPNDLVLYYGLLSFFMSLIKSSIAFYVYDKKPRRLI